MPVVSTGQITITDVNDSPSAVLSNESAVVPANPDGSSPVLTGCITTLSVNLGGVDDSLNWTVAAAPSSGVTGTLATRTYTVTGFTVDAGWVDLTATRVGWPSLTKRFNLSKSKQGVTGATGAAGSNGLNFSEAKLLFSDPTFQVGSNGVSVYNNSGGGTVTHARIAKLADSPFTDSGFNIEVSNTGVASPGIGGFVQLFNARASAVFVQRIVAKLPVGYSLEQATNAMGDGATNTWITSKTGTGKFEEYILVRRCGATGSFSSSGHIYAIGTAGTPSVPVKWWLAYAATYDFTALGFSTVVGLLSNDSHTVPTDSAGNNGNFTGAATTLTIFNGTADDSANWAVTAAATNVTGSLVGRTYTVTAMSADTGFVDLTATRGGFSNVVKRFTLSKSKGGVTGATGATGAQGPQGVQGPAVVVTPDRATTFTSTDGTLDGSQADIVFTAAVSGVTSPTYAWTFSGLQTNPTASITATQTVTAAQFGTSKAAIVTCTVSGAYTDKVTIVRLERSTAAAGANQTSIDASGNIQGVSSGAGQSVANNVDNVIRSPGGALSVNNASSVTGALKIKLPQLWTNTMMRFTVEIYEYLAGFTCTLEVAGYNHTGSGGYWVNCTARVIGGSNVEYPARFGRDADKCCVWIGNSTETWSYPQVRVRDFFGGHSNASASQWSTGWAISFDTTTLTAAGSNLTANQFNVHITDTLPGADWAKTSGANKPADNATRNVHRGLWVNGTNYVAGDTVIHQGYGWSNILTTSSVAPPTFPVTSNANWTLAAVKGEDAKAVYLTASSQVLKVNTANVVTPSSITLTATGQNCAGSPTFTVTSGTAMLTGSGTTRELAASAMTTDQVTVTVDWDGRSDVITLTKVREGSEAITLQMSNEAHILVADQEGVVTSFDGSGSDIVVYQGSSMLTAFQGGAPGTYTVGTPVVTPPGAYTPGAVAHNGDRAVLANGVAMAGDAAVVTLPVTVTRTDGTTTSFVLRQSVAKARRGLTGPTFRLLASSPGFRFTDGQANPVDQTLAITALRFGVQGDVVYELVDGNGEVVLSGDGMWTGLGAALGLPMTGTSDDAYVDAAVLSGRQSVTVRATCGEFSDSVTLVRLNDTTAAAGATVGAPSGTPVGSTPAETVEANANNSHAAVFDPSTGLAQRMRANADNVLGGVLMAEATTAPVGMRVGSVTWDAAGDVTGGSGVAITPKGVYARNPSKTTFVLDATTGDATFSGNLAGANITGATGTFSGSLTAETLGSLAQPPVTITTTGNVTVPAGMNSVRYELVGGGGGGGGGATAFVAGYGGGGGSGAYMSGTLAVTAGATLAITIGTGGAGGANTLAGGNGTASSIGALVTAAGGTGGGGSAAGAGFGVGGATPTSVPTAASKAGATAARVYDGLNTTHDGYGSFNGEAKYDGAGFPKFGVTGAGGANPLGTGGASVNTGVGSAGTGYGSGGAGGGGSLSTNVTATGGAGRPGMCRLTFLNSNGVVLQSQFENLKQVLAAQGIAVA